MLIDRFGRKIDYLRISVTDRCNFRRIYCITHKEWKYIPHEEILRFEEILEIVKAGIKLGIKRVRITGGEPLVRKNIEFLIEKLCEFPELKDVSLTTNGYFLEELGEKVRRAGLRRINISLDTLNKEKFKKLTGVDGFEKVRRGIDLALELGFKPVKINVVVIKGFNDDEVVELAKLTLEKPVEVRFIEFMPIGKNPLWDEKNIFPAEEIKKRLKEFAPLISVSSLGGGPAEVFKWEGALGKIGLISPVTRPFCSRCNRLRITADGKLRPCLFSDFEINLKPVIREGRGTLEEAFKKAVAFKPEKHHLNFTEKFMRAIGG